MDLDNFMTEGKENHVLISTSTPGEYIERNIEDVLAENMLGILQDICKNTKHRKELKSLLQELINEK